MYRIGRCRRGNIFLDIKDRVYDWADMYPTYLMSNRIMVTSMIYPSEFLTRYYYYISDFRRAITAWDIFLRQLKEEKPRLIIDDSNGFSANTGFLYLRKNKYVDLKLRELRDFVKENYRAPEAVGKFQMYRLKATQKRHKHK